MTNISEKDGNSIETEEANRVLVESIRRKLQPMPSHQPFIYELPEKFGIDKKEENEYEPQIVSIGPIHHGKEKLEALEDQKKWYLHSLLSRSVTPVTCLEESVEAIREMEEEIRKCYKRPINLSSDGLVEMMIFDGYFMLELFYYFKNEVVRDENDLVFNILWMLPMLRGDLVALENQMPFIILNKLYEVCKDPEQGGPDLSYLVLNFCCPMLPTSEPVPENSSCFGGKHVLELLRNYLVLSSQQQLGTEYNQDDTILLQMTFSATDLSEAGVKFKKVEDCGLLDIRFDDKKGVLEIPHFFFGRGAAHLLRNLVLLEQCDRSLTTEITSFVNFIGDLIKSERDVRLLQQRGIIEWYSKNYLTADRLAKLLRGTNFDNFRYGEICLRINRYYRSDSNRWRAILKRDYFNTPWAIISFLAAIVLLILTFLQTMFSIRSTK